jgi:hypothetical protein
MPADVLKIANDPELHKKYARQFFNNAVYLDFLKFIETNFQEGIKQLKSSFREWVRFYIRTACLGYRQDLAEYNVFIKQSFQIFAFDYSLLTKLEKVELEYVKERFLRNALHKNYMQFFGTITGARALKIINDYRHQIGQAYGLNVVSPARDQVIAENIRHFFETSNGSIFLFGGSAHFQNMVRTRDFYGRKIEEIPVGYLLAQNRIPLLHIMLQPDIGLKADIELSDTSEEALVLRYKPKLFKG